MQIGIFLTILVLLLCIFYFFLNWRSEQQLKKLRRKYDEQNGPSGIGTDLSRAGEIANSISVGEPDIKRDEQHEGRELLQDTINLSSTTDQPEPIQTEGLEDGNESTNTEQEVENKD